MRRAAYLLLILAIAVGISACSPYDGYADPHYARSFPTSSYPPAAYTSDRFGRTASPSFGSDFSFGNPALSSFGSGSRFRNAGSPYLGYDESFFRGAFGSGALNAAAYPEPGLAYGRFAIPTLEYVNTARYRGATRGSSYQSYGDPLVAHVQRLLAMQGFDPGPIDGIYGRYTAEAIARYQYAVGLPVTGRLDQRLIFMLGRGRGF